MGYFRVPKNILFGENSLEELKNLKGKKATLITGGSSMKRFGFLAKSEQYLKEAGMEVSLIEDVEPNPSVATVKRGAEELRKFNPDWIIGIGGGSAIDAAKIMWAFYEYPELKFEDIIQPGSMPELRNKAKFVAIPSTSGTATEITAFSVITDTENSIKYPIVSYEITPDIAIVDPVIAATMPASITVNTGMDVITHAVEAYVSTAASSYTDPLALDAIKLVMKWLPIAYKDGSNMEARTNMHNASTMAGMAFTNASLGIVHSLAHKIGGELGITHGLANAILLPYVIDFNRKYTTKYTNIEEALGIKDFSSTLMELNRQLGIPRSLKNVTEVEITEEKFLEVLDRMAKNAHEDPCTLTNPAPVDADAMKKIYKAAFYGLPIE